MTYFTPTDFKMAKPLVELLREANQEVPPELQALIPMRGNDGGSGGRPRPRGGASRDRFRGRSAGGRNDYGDRW